MPSPSGAEQQALAGDLYRFGPGLVVRISGDRRARAYFHAEYGAAALAPDAEEPALVATVGTRVRDRRTSWSAAAPDVQGSHKLARWCASVAGLENGGPMRASVQARGPMGLMLAQSYIVEPLISLAALRAESVLLPSAAIARDGKAVLLIGRSRSGKSSLAARALAAGVRVLGDDQVLVTGSRDCLPFPRRLRVYPDLAWTAPAAFGALRPAARGALSVLGRVSAVTRGFVAPPLRISASTLSSAPAPDRVPIGEAVVIGRAPVDALTTQRMNGGELAAEAEDALRSQRSAILDAPRLKAELATALEQERATLRSAFADLPARRVLVPVSWTAEQAVGTLAQELGLER
jgi:hypothetical protein